MNQRNNFFLAGYCAACQNLRLAAAVSSNEGGGLSQADILVRIPMHGVADSLNVAMATTLLLYEAERQRTNT